jgi:hypothetical protein
MIYCQNVCSCLSVSIVIFFFLKHFFRISSNYFSLVHLSRDVICWVMTPTSFVTSNLSNLKKTLIVVFGARDNLLPTLLIIIYKSIIIQAFWVIKMNLLDKSKRFYFLVKFLFGVDIRKNWHFFLSFIQITFLLVMQWLLLSVLLKSVGSSNNNLSLSILVFWIDTFDLKNVGKKKH